MSEINYTGFKEIPSTNSYSLENIEAIQDKSVIFAGRQTQGRGRFNRVWESDNPENLYFSLVLKPCSSLNNNLPLANLTQYMSLVLSEVLDTYGVNSSIKWPNDVLVDGKKIAGILAETSIKKGVLQGLVIGVGVNLNSTLQDIEKITQSATSLNLEIAKKTDKEVFLRQVTEKFFDNYDRFLSEGFTLIKSDYTQKCSFIGSQILIKEPDLEYAAFAESINDDGTLKIKVKNEIKNITTGDVILQNA